MFDKYEDFLINKKILNYHDINELKIACKNFEEYSSSLIWIIFESFSRKVKVYLYRKILNMNNVNEEYEKLLSECFLDEQSNLNNDVKNTLAKIAELWKENEEFKI